MARYKITFTYSQQPSDGSSLFINDSLSQQLFRWGFYATGSPQFWTPVNIGELDYSQTKYNHKESFRAIYNLSGMYEVGEQPDIWWLIGEWDAPPVVSSNDTNITVEITEELPLIAITSTDIQAGSDVCNVLNILVTASLEFNELLSPYAETFTDTLTKVVENRPRGTVQRIQIRDDNGATSFRNVQMPSYLNLGLLNISVINNTVTITDTTSGLTLEYSLDDANWKYENTFNNLTNGDYTLYVRDQYGCKVSTTFTIAIGQDGVIVIPDPYFHYSKSNPIRMAKRIQWDESTIHKNSKNTLSCEVLDSVVHQQKHLYRSSDTFRLQVKSSYDDLAIITSDDEVSQSLEQMTANIGTKIAMDCKVINLGTTWGVYFVTGNYYNYDTDDDLGTDYILNGSLPQFAKIGNIITIGGFNYTIADINYNEDINADQIVLNSAALTEGDAIIKSIYNAENWEVIECSIAVLGRPDFNVEIWFDGQLQYSSELISVISDPESYSQLALVEWSMNYNTDMYWSTGIEGKARLMVDTMKAGTKNENEKYQTDEDVVQTDSDDFEVDIVKFLPQTKEVTRYILNWLSSSTIKIRGIEYVKDSVEVEPLGRSNLYTIEATLLMKGSGLYKDKVGNINVEIPELLITEADEFIKL